MKNYNSQQTSMAIEVACFLAVLATRDWFPYLFTSNQVVAELTTKISFMLSIIVLLNSLQPVLSGVAIGAGWQAIVAYINIGCYYLVGLPAGKLLGFTLGFGVVGIWSRMIGGICLQTLILVVVVWSQEASKAESRMQQW